MVGVPVEPLIGSGRVTEELHRAAAEGELETVVRLIGLGANVDSCDQNGATPLQKAACGGHIQVVQHLLKKCANVDHQDSQHGNTALHECSWKGYSQTTECLVKAKSNVYLKNQGGFAPLHLACQNGHNQTCRVLLLAGCRPDIKNNYGDTPIHTAARYGHAGVTRILLSARANVKEINKNGDTGLHIAAAMGRRKLTRMLLEADADQTIKNKQGETPADIAIRKDFLQILDILQNPPKILTIDERLRQEQLQKKEETNKERGKKDKKREKMNDSGTSSKESGTKHKEKKKMKGNPKIDPKTRSARLSSWGVDWSPYGCHVAPPTDNTIVPPKLDSLPTDPLIRGEQYFVDLAGNIKKGPVGIGATCFCAPLFQNVQNKMEKDKIDLMDHIDQAHGKLNDRISSLETHTKGHIQKLGQTVQEKLAMERSECRAQNCRLRESQNAEMDKKVVQLQGWIERRLSNHHPDSPSSMRRMRGSLNRTYPLTRSKSEEAISEIRGDDVSDEEEPLYKGLRVLDHPTSMYNIPHNIDMETNPHFYDGANSPHNASDVAASRTDRKQYLQSLFGMDQRSHPQNGMTNHISGFNLQNGSSFDKSRNMSESCLSALDNTNSRIESDLIKPRNRGPLIGGSINVINNCEDKTDGTGMLDEAVGNLHVRDMLPTNDYVTRNGQVPFSNQLSRKDQNFSNEKYSRPDLDISRVSQKYDVELTNGGAVRKRNLPALPPQSEYSRNFLKMQNGQLNQSRTESTGNTSYSDSSKFSKLNDSDPQHYSAEASHAGLERFGLQTPELCISPQSRYNFRNGNPYMFNLRSSNSENSLPYREEKHVLLQPNFDGRGSQHTSTPEGRASVHSSTPEGRLPAYSSTSVVGTVVNSYNSQIRPLASNATLDGRLGDHGLNPESRLMAYNTTPDKPPVSFNLQPTQSYHASVLYNSPDSGSTYLDMDRYRIQAAVKKLYDGYLADGHMETAKPTGKLSLETSTEHDSHNDSGYSTRLCSASQGPSPALPVAPYVAVREEVRANGVYHPPDVPQYHHYTHHHSPWRANGRYSENETPALALHNTSSSLSEAEIKPHSNGTDERVRSPPLHKSNGGVFIGESSLV